MGRKLMQAKERGQAVGLRTRRRRKKAAKEPNWKLEQGREERAASPR